jgi:hypothetical protein
MNSKRIDSDVTSVRAPCPQTPPQGWEGGPSFTPPEPTSPQSLEGGFLFTPPEPVPPGPNKAKKVRLVQNAPSRKHPARLLMPPRDSQIAPKAYAIWERRGRPADQALSNWFAAESELRFTPTRRALIERVGAEIDAGTYETRGKIDAAIDRLLTGLT